jgi:hypothetical protein
LFVPNQKAARGTKSETGNGWLGQPVIIIAVPPNVVLPVSVAVDEHAVECFSGSFFNFEH